MISISPVCIEGIMLKIKAIGVPIDIPKTEMRLCLSDFVNREKSAISTGNKTDAPTRIDTTLKSGIGSFVGT